MLDFINQWISEYLALFTYFSSANKRVFWPYLLSAGVIAICYLVTTTKHRSIPNAFKTLFSADIWLHQSAKCDYLMFFINPAIKAVLRLFIVFSMAPVAVIASSLFSNYFGFIDLTVSVATVTLVLTGTLFIADDLTRFLTHLLMHKIPILWALHKAHHSATVLTPFTVYRVHPIESLIYQIRNVVTQGVVIGIFFALFGNQLSIWQVLSASGLTFIFNIIGANLRHSHIPLGYPKLVEKWFISPAQHQIHHSADNRHFDKNYGSFLSCWDRALGCLLFSRENTVTSFGLGSNERQSHHSLTAIYLSPLSEIRNKFSSLYKKLSISGHFYKSK